MSLRALRYRLLCLLLIAACLSSSLPAALSETAAGLRFCEVMSRNASALQDASGEYPDWFSLENASDEPWALAGCAIMRSDKPGKPFIFSSGTLAPGERIVLIADGSAARSTPSELHTDFKLSSSGVRLELLDPDGDLLDCVDVPALKRDETYARDEAGAWVRKSASGKGQVDELLLSTTEEALLDTEFPETVQISEIVASNATYGPRLDYVEVVNTTDSALSLDGWYLTDELIEVDKWVFPAMDIGPGERVVVPCTGEEDAIDLAASFRLSRSGGCLLLSGPDAQPVSYVRYPALSTDQAWSLTDDGWTSEILPTPKMENTEENGRVAHDALFRSKHSPLLISEIAASVSGDDWIELLNEGTEPVDLSGYGLSDDIRHPRAWQFPQGTVLQPGAYLTVYATGEELSPEKLCTSFRLSAKGGESVVLSDADGDILDRVYLGPQYKNVAYGRTEGTRELRYFPTPSPGAANPATGYLGWAQPPEYSEYGGLYTSGQTLQIALSAPSGSRIHYTLDSTDPTESSPLYDKPITVDQTTVLRTRVYRDDYIPSYMDTQSYLFDVNNGEGTVFVMSMVSDPDNLDGRERGITANPQQDWEREGHIEVFAPDGTPLLSQECGIKLHGMGSRVLDEKTFTIIARNIYGDNRFHAALFSRRPYTEYQSFLLRPSSEDSTMTRMRDAVLSSLAEDTSVLYQEYEVGVLYIDGRYWGHYNLRERINTTSICQFEGWEGREDALDLVKGNDQVMQGSDDSMRQLLKYVKSADMTTEEAYRTLDSAIDIQNYIEYMCLEMFVGNTDTLNIKRYRDPQGDGKWRWALFDLDWAFYNDINSITRWLRPGGAGHKQATDNTLYIACMKNPTFRDRLLTHLGQQLATTFAAENVLARIRAFYEVLEPLLPDTFERWGLSERNYEKHMQKFEDYARTRPVRMLQCLKYDGTLKLSESQMEHYFGEAMREAGVTYDELKEP